MNDDLLANLGKLHSTVLGMERIRSNIGLEDADPVAWVKHQVENAKTIIRKRKNWYVYVDSALITINAHSFTIFTAHKTA